MSLTLSFRGLCAFVQRGNMVEVLLNPTHGSHRPTLTVRTEYLDPDSVDPRSRWRPDFLGHVPVFERNGQQQVQIAVWDLTGVRVSFRGDRQASCPSTNIIALGKYHYKNNKNAETLQHPAGFGIVELGKCQIDAVDIKNFRLTCANSVSAATELRCSGLPIELFSARGAIRFCASANPVAIVSNLSSEIDRNRPFQHFEHYYDVIVRDGEPIPPPERCSLEPSGAIPVRQCDGGQPGIQTDEVYDCVPPAGGP